MTAVSIDRRLANFRAAVRAAGQPDEPRPNRSAEHIARLAATVDGEVVRSPLGTIVRCESPSSAIPVDRERLARLPGQPPASAPLLCLDTETTGLATAAGTLAFLVGLGWWEDDRFRQVQLLLPDHPAEPALLTILAGHIPANGWLVTYNGRGFDWPLLVARYRMARRDPPVHAGHLDLLPFVRRVMRHRLPDARLRSVETHLLGIERHGDVEGWEIPGRYLDFLRFGASEQLVEVVRHNREDVVALARLVAHVDERYGGRASDVPPGDLAGLARAYARERRLPEALDCLERAIGSSTRSSIPYARESIAEQAARREDPPWWAPRRPVDFGGRLRQVREVHLDRRQAFDSPWTDERIAVERARLLRRLGRFEDAVAAWLGLAGGLGPVGAQAWIEVAKLREHRLGDPAGALAAVDRAWATIERRRRLARRDPRLEMDLSRRQARLRARLAVA